MRSSTRGLDKMCPENILSAHVGRKLGQTSEGQTPGGVHPFRFAVSQALDPSAESLTHREARNKAPSKSQGPDTSTSHGFTIFSPPTQQNLGIDITRLQARHRWCPPLKILKVINLFESKKAQPSPLLCSPCTCSATCVPGAQLNKSSQLLEKTQPPLGEKAIKKEAIPSPLSPLLTPSPTNEGIQKVLGETPPGNGHASSEAPLTTQESRPWAQTSTCVSVGRIWHSEMAVGDHRASLELSPAAATARSEPSGESGGRAAGDSHHRVTAWEGSTGSRSPSADEDGGSVAAEEASAWKATLESSVPAHSQMTRVVLRSSGTPGTSKIPTLPSAKHVIQDLEEPRLDAQHRDSGLHKKVESGKQPLDSGPGELLQDCDTHALLQHCHSPAFLADSSASQTSLCGSQSTSSEDMSAVHVSGDVMFSEWASQQSSWGLKGSWRPEEQDKNQSKMFVPAGEEKACRRSNQGQHGKELAELRASQDNGMLKNKDKETVESIRSKSYQLGLKEEQATPESHFTKKRQHFLQGIFSSKVPQQKGRPPSATAQSQGQHNSRSVPDSGAARAQGIATAMGQIPEERITLQHGRPPSELNWHKGQFQAPAGEHGATDFSYHRLLSYEEQGRMTREEACSLQATLKGHSSPGKSRQARDKDGSRAFPPRELGCPARPSQQGPRAAGASACTHHHPRLCVIQNYVSPVQLV